MQYTKEEENILKVNRKKRTFMLKEGEQHLNSQQKIGSQIKYLTR